MNSRKSHYCNEFSPNNYEVIGHFDDVHFKNCVILKSFDDPFKKLLLKTINTKDSTTIDDLMIKINNFSNEYLINLIYVNKTFRNDNYQYDFYIDAFSSNLSLEMKFRQTERNYFTEEELWEILNSILKGICYLHDQEIFHGELQPNMIKITKNDRNDNYIIKILHPWIIELINEEFHDKEEKYCLSPEEFISLKYNETKLYIDYFKADVYCLGLCLLEAATFFSIKSCYDWETYLMNYEFILRKLLIIHNRYSKDLAYILKNMLVVDDKTRPTIFEIEILLSNEKELEIKDKRCLYLSPMKNKYNVETNVFFLLNFKIFSAK